MKYNEEGSDMLYSGPGMLARWQWRQWDHFVKAFAVVWIQGLAKVRSIVTGGFWVMGRRGDGPKARVSGLTRSCF